MTNKEIVKVLRRNIKLALENRGWNQSDLARELGVVRQRANYILGSESYKATLEHVINISQALSIPIDWLVDPNATWPAHGTKKAEEPKDSVVLTRQERFLIDTARYVEEEAGEDPKKLRVSIATLMGRVNKTQSNGTGGH